jgi:hypothetical protein
MPSLFQYGMSLNMGAYFQGGVSLKARVWVDHCPHGDRHERSAAQNGGAIARLSQRHTGCTVPVHRRRYEALRVHRGGSQAPVLPPPRACRQGCGVALSRTPHRLLPPAGDQAGAPFARRGSAGQALFGTPRWLCPQVHHHRRGLARGDRRPARHAIRACHEIPHATPFRGVRGWALWAACQHLGCALVQPAPWLATRRGGCTGPRPGAIQFPSPSGVPLPPMDALVSSVSTVFTKGIRTAWKASITSMPWTAWPSSRLSPPASG